MSGSKPEEFSSNCNNPFAFGAAAVARFLLFCFRPLRNRRFSVMRSNKNHKIEDFDRVLADPFMGFARTLL
jgi:hypothetical protein